MKRKMISKIMAAALIGTMCAGMAVPVMAADDEKVTLSVINYHVGTDYAAEYYSYLFEAFQQTEEGKNVEFSFEEFLQQMHLIRKSNFLSPAEICRISFSMVETTLSSWLQNPEK